ncbi:MAG: chalcone isomerase family protein [Proteobacteria bacterium]|nr:chalcone isomerase family protein [Pseudomonadota bacterium]
MNSLFPDVSKGTTLTGLNVPGKGARFFHDGRPLGEIAGTEFARAFFSIWLDPQSSAPALRSALMGEG